MNDRSKHPWPRSWPPLWRGVLHVVIAAAAGNAFLAVSLAAGADHGNLAKHFGDVSGALVWEAGSLLTVLIVALLGGATMHTTLSLLLAYSLGVLAMTWWTRSLLPGDWSARLRESAILISSVLAGFPVVGLLFMLFNPGVSRRQVLSVALLGVLMLLAALAWAFGCGAYLYSSPYCHYYPSCYGLPLDTGPEIFALSLAGLVGFPLIFAITAMRSIRAAQRASAAPSPYRRLALRIAATVSAVAVAGVLGFTAQRCQEVRDLWHAVGDGDLAKVDRLLQSGVPVNSVYADRGTPLHLAAAVCDKEMVGLCVSRGADVNAKERYGDSTPLHFAVSGGRTDVVKLLVENGANVNARDTFGTPPLHYAASYGYEDTAEVLIARGAQVSARSPNGATPLDLAEQGGHKNIAVLLRKHGGKFGRELRAHSMSIRKEEDWGQQRNN